MVNHLKQKQKKGVKAIGLYQEEVKTIGLYQKIPIQRIPNFNVKSEIKC